MAATVALTNLSKIDQMKKHSQKMSSLLSKKNDANIYLYHLVNKENKWIFYLRGNISLASFMYEKKKSKTK